MSDKQSDLASMAATLIAFHNNVPTAESQALVAALVATYYHTFTCFPRLPAELRLKIWRATLPPLEQQEIEITPMLCQNGFPSKNGVSLSDTRMVALRVSRESRQLAISHFKERKFQLCFHKLFAEPVLFNFEANTLSFQDWNALKIRTIPGFHDLSERQIASIHCELAFKLKVYGVRNLPTITDLGLLLHHFECLKSIEVVVDIAHKKLWEDGLCQDLREMIEGNWRYVALDSKPARRRAPRISFVWEEEDLRFR